MYNLGIFVPVYYSEEEVAKILMRLTEMAYNGMRPSVFICVNGIRQSFRDTFIEDYVSKYSANSDNPVDPIFERVEVIYDDLTFDPTDMINNAISNDPDMRYVAIIEPKSGIEDRECFSKFITIFNEYDFRRKLGGICTDTGMHHMGGDHIRWQVERNIVVRSLDGDGFSNGVLMTERNTWKKVNGFSGKEYTNEFSKKCFRHGFLLTYAEGIK